MKVLVLRDAAGKITSVAVPGTEFAGRLQMEVVGGPKAHEVEVDENAISPDELLGKKGHEARTKAIQKLHKLL
ncbi:MAG TPA: hypothetical protein VIG99_19040 [Myxococcaceae bacterium]|jgi:hypothetical protein